MQAHDLSPWVATQHLDIAGVRPQQTQQDADGRGLPGTVRAQEPVRTSPRATSRSRPSNAAKAPNRFTSPTARIAGSPSARLSTSRLFSS